MLRNQCGAIDGVRYMWCTIYGAIDAVQFGYNYVVQSTWCKICDKTPVVHDMLCDQRGTLHVVHSV
eukprot:3658115-Pyramimonas_sp.AAC.1